MIGQRLLSRWDVSPDEQADRSFGQVVTLINLRRVEIACLLGILTRAVELATGFKPIITPFEILFMMGFLFGALALRRTSNERLAQAVVAAILVLALLTAQWGVAAFGAQGRLTSGYPMMLLSLTLLFVVPPRLVIGPLIGLLLLYCWIVLRTATTAPEKTIAIVNAALVTVIAIIASALIYAARRRDYDQRREIRLQNRRLIERNDELDALMAITAHDLRSPLYGLRNLIDLAVRRAAQEPALPLKVLHQSMASLDSMLALATRLLDAHAAEHEPLDGVEQADVRGHILAAKERIAPLAQGGDARIELNLPDHPLVAVLNAGAFGQILDNLLGNAVRYAPRGSAISIFARSDGSRIAVTIRDRGQGVDSGAVDHLFTRFHRAPGSKPEGLAGKGLGLFIVATLAERMGATVVYAPAEGGGACFTISLPRGD